MKGGPRFYAESDGGPGRVSHYVVDRYGDPLGDQRRTDCESRREARQLAQQYNACQIVEQLPRPLYLKTDKVLRACGGKWNRGQRSHLFDGDGEASVREAVASGEYIDLRKTFQDFETPEDLAADVVQHASIAAGEAVLEPSAGGGRLAEVARSHGGRVTCVELQAEKAKKLQEAGFVVYGGSCGDFLQYKPQPQLLGLFDVVVMNPPFSKNQDIKHVRHAFDFLKVGGRLVAIMSVGWTFRSDRAATDFRTWATNLGADWTDNPDGSFKSSGTNVRTVTLYIKKV